MKISMIISLPSPCSPVSPWAITKPVLQSTDVLARVPVRSPGSPADVPVLGSPAPTPACPSAQLSTSEGSVSSDKEKARPC
jgi:hypothetical protein